MSLRKFDYWRWLIIHIVPSNCTYSSICISSLPKFKEDMNLATSFVASFILDFFTFIIHGKIGTHVCSKILDILHQFCMV